jgi:hypothetical protein
MIKRILIAVAFLAAGCSGMGPILLVHPKTGERIRCAASGAPGYILVATSQCARQYEALGFIRAENLTAEQRDTVGATSKPTASRVEQDVTIRPGAAK